VERERVERADLDREQQDAAGKEAGDAPARGREARARDQVGGGQTRDDDECICVPGEAVRIHAGYASQRRTRPWCSGNTTAFQAVITGSNPVGRFSKKEAGFDSWAGSLPSDTLGMLSRVKTKERIRARELRQVEGRSVREIQEILGVSPSSVSLWVRDIELSPEQHAALHARNPAYNGQRAGTEAKIAKYRAIRARYQRDGRSLVQGNPDFAAGCMLYWAEGRKTRNSAQMTNSDPEVLRFFAKFLRRYFAVPDEQFSVRCNLFADHLARQQEVEWFWLDTLSLQHSCLRKSIVNVYSKHSQKKRRNMLPYGTCQVSVHRTQIVQTIFGAIQEYGGFDRPEWLD
jgi:hypothetical protein